MRVRPIDVGVAELVATHSTHGLETHNVYHFADVGGMTPDDWDRVIAAFYEWWTGAFLGPFGPQQLMSRGASLVEIGLTFLFGALERQKYGSFLHLLPLPGSLDLDPVPANVTFALHWDIGIRGHGSGRTFLQGLPEAYLVGGARVELDRTYLAQLVAVYGALSAAIYESTEPFGKAAQVIFHRYGRSLSGGGVTYYDPVTAVRYVDRVVDSQRRRLPNHHARG